MYEFRLEGSQGALKCRGLHMSNDTMDYEIAPALGQFAAKRIDERCPRAIHSSRSSMPGTTTCAVAPNRRSAAATT